MVKVEATGWPDYKLTPYQNLKPILKINKYLSEVLSANQVGKAEHLGEINKILLKIEALKPLLIQ